MKILFDILPVVVFFVAFKTVDDPQQGILVATAAAIGAAILQLGYVWVKTRRMETMHLVTLAILVVLGGATLLFGDERFIKWKPTAVNWLFAAVFFGSEFIGDRNIVRRIMEGQVSLPASGWRRLNAAWAVFFTAMGVANLYVAQHYPTAVWVDFKMFGILGLTVLFVIGQAFFLVRYSTIVERDGDR